MAKKRSGGSQVDWLPASAYRTAMNATAQDAQVTIADVTIEHLGNSQDYASGALVGLRAWFSMYAGSAQTTPSEFVVLVLPSALAVPTVITGANKKANEKYVWFIGLMTLRESAAGAIQDAVVDIGSSRRFDQSDRLVIVYVNRGAATAASGVGTALVDVYVRES